MNRCPITYELCEDKRYSTAGLKQLSRNLKNLKDFPHTPKEQIQLAAQLAAKLSIQGIQPKLSIVLNVSQEEFQIVEKGGTFILKPPHHIYDEVPQNEDVIMRLAKVVGIEIPLHGMIYNIDGSLSYFIKRFDRAGKQKIAVEDFSQLLGFSRETKYESSMEKVVSDIEKHCTFPLIEKLKLFRLVIFNFLVGNEDMHLKNFSLIRRGNKVELSPSYDLLNTTIIIQAKEEIALPLNGKTSHLNSRDFINYFGQQRLKLPDKVLMEEMTRFEKSLEMWEVLITESFLSEKTQERCLELIRKRWKIVNRS